MQDIKPLPIARSDDSPGNTFGTVPVKKPTSSASLTQQVDNPIATDPRTLAQFASEAEMDKILDDINKKVQAGSAGQNHKKGFFTFFKRADKKSLHASVQPADKVPAATQPPPADKKRRVIPAIAAAVIVGAILCVMAFAAFAKQDTAQPNNAGNQIPPDSNQGNSSVTSEDVSKLSSDIKKQAETLLAEEDFSGDELSDSALGL